MRSPNKEWLKIIIKAEPVLVDSISDFLIGIIGAGVETGAVDEDSYGTINGYVEQSDPDEDEITGIKERVGSYLTEIALLFEVATPEVTCKMIGDEDWGKSWKEHFKPFPIVPGLIISPSWEDYTPGPGELMIEMDPGMAFGTGHHATTSLALGCIKEAITSYEETRNVLENPEGVRGLDVGTGTGILGMAAVLFGADQVLGIDNDPDAVTAANETVMTNSLQKNMEVSITSLSSLKDSYQIVVANIVHDVLVERRTDLMAVTATGGVLILSGILEGEQAVNIVNTFTGNGFLLAKKEVKGEWVALMVTRAV